MWDYDEVEKVNSDLPRRLHKLINSGAADPSILCSAATLLDDMSPTQQVFGFAQLPFALAVKPGQRFVVNIPEGRVASLTFSHFRVEFDGTNMIKLVTYEIANGPASGVGTQVQALIGLWGRHVRYFDN